MAEIKGIRLSGFLGWSVWLVFHLLQIVDFRSRLVVLINWTVDYVFLDRPVRLIARLKDNPLPDPEGAGKDRDALPDRRSV